MLNLPKATEVNKLLPKNAIFSRLSLNTIQKSKFDKDISRVYIYNEISKKTVNISEGEAVKSIFVLKITLKSKEFDEKNIILLSKLIPQNIVYLLEYEEEFQFAIFQSKLMKTEWARTSEIPLQGLNLDIVWKNIVEVIGDFRVEKGRTLQEQIAEEERKAKIAKQIEQLEKKARTEKQPKKKFEIVEEIKRLKEGCLYDDK